MKKVILLCVSLFTCTTLFAASPMDDNPSRRGIESISHALENADENDSKAYTKAAQLAINWNADLEMAKEWLEHAQNIDKNASNLEVEGDYYMRKGDNISAFNSYREALINGNFTLEKESIHRLQYKMTVNANYKK